MAETLEQRAARFARLGRALLPKGHAWARFPGANFRDLLSATLYEFARVETQIDTFSDEMDPRETSLLLTEWENALGLPDECGAATTTEGRRAAILARLTDSGTNTEAALAAALANLDGGATLEIGTPTQFEVAGLIDTPLTPPIAGASLDLNPDSANTIVTDGAVETLADDAAGNDPTQSTASLRPTYTASDSDFGGRASMTFDSPPQGLTQSAWQAGGGGAVFTIYAVFKMGTPTGGRIYGNNTDAGTGRFRILAGASGTDISINWTSPGPNYTTKQITGLTPGQVYRLAAVFDISSGSDAIPLVYLNGAPAGSYAFTNASNDTEFENVSAGVGSNPAITGQFFDGKIGRIIGYNAAHTTTQIEIVDAWLAQYYGSLASPSIDLNPGSANTVVISGAVATLADDSGGGHNATSGVTAEYPAFIAQDPDFGYRASLSFDGTDDRLVVSSFQAGGGSSDFTVYLVIRTGALSGFKTVFGHGGSVDPRFTCSLNGSNFNFTYAEPAGQNTIWSFSAEADTIYRFAVRFDSSDGPAAIKAAYVNGISRSISYTATDASNAASWGAESVGVGADQGGTFGWFDGKIARIIAYDAAHTDAQIKATDAWLAEYYKLSTPPIAGASIDLNPDSPNTVVISGAVDTLADDSGNGLAATQGTASNRPTFIYSDPLFGNRASIQGDGVDHYMVTPAYQPGGSSGTDYTLYMVFQTAASAATTVIWGPGVGAGTGRFQIREYNGGASVQIRWESPGGSATSKVITTKPFTVYRLACVFDYATGADAIPTVYVDGVDSGVAYSLTSAANDTEAESTAHGVLAIPSGSAPWAGRLARVIGFDAAHTATQIVDMDTWLANHFKLKRPTASLPPIAGASIDLNPDSGGTIAIDGAVYQLSDDSGNELAAVQATDTKRPTFNYADIEFGGRDTMSFDVTDDGFLTPSFQPGGGGTDFTLYGAIKTGATAAVGNIFGTGINAGNGRIGVITLSNSNMRFTISSGFAMNTQLTYNVGSNTVVRFAVRFDGSESGVDAIPDIYIDGVKVTPVTTASAFNPIADYDDLAHGVGTNLDDTSDYYDGKIARLIGYNAAHNAIQIAAMDAWMAEYFDL